MIAAFPMRPFRWLQCNDAVQAVDDAVAVQVHLRGGVPQVEPALDVRDGGGQKVASALEVALVQAENARVAHVGELAVEAHPVGQVIESRVLETASSARRP